MSITQPNYEGLPSWSKLCINPGEKKPEWGPWGMVKYSGLFLAGLGAKSLLLTKKHDFLEQNQFYRCTGARSNQLTLHLQEICEVVDAKLVAWNWPQWEYLYHRNWQMPQIKASFPIQPVFKHLTVHHLSASLHLLIFLSSYRTRRGHGKTVRQLPRQVFGWLSVFFPHFPPSYTLPRFCSQTDLTLPVANEVHYHFPLYYWIPAHHYLLCNLGQSIIPVSRHAYHYNEENIAHLMVYVCWEEVVNGAPERRCLELGAV